MNNSCGEWEFVMETEKERFSAKKQDMYLNKIIIRFAERFRYWPSIKSTTRISQIC